jgi:hypothetical protein
MKFASSMSDEDTHKRLAQIIDALAADWLQTQNPIVKEVMVDLGRELSKLRNDIDFKS